MLYVVYCLSTTEYSVQIYRLYIIQFVPPEWICRSGGDGSLFGAFRALASHVHLVILYDCTLVLLYNALGLESAMIQIAIQMTLGTK